MSTWDLVYFVSMALVVLVPIGIAYTKKDVYPRGILFLSLIGSVIPIVNCIIALIALFALLDALGSKGIFEKSLFDFRVKKDPPDDSN